MSHQKNSASSRGQYNFRAWDISDLVLGGEAPVSAGTPAPAELASGFPESVLATIAGRPPDYADDFSRADSGWHTGSTASGGEWGYREDGFFFSMSTPPEGECCVSASSEGLPSLDDFVLEVDGQFVAGEWGGWFVVFRDSQQPSGDSSGRPSGTCYGVRFLPDGTFGVWKNISGTHVELLEAGGHADAFVQGFAANHLTVVAAGSRLAFYVNGERIWMVDDEAAPGGRIALGIENQSRDTILQVRFDNLQVWDITDLGLPDATAEP